MTLSTTEVRSSVAPTAQGRHIATPRDIAIETIQKELRGSRNQAAVCLEFVEDMLMKARSGERTAGDMGVYHLTPDDMSRPGYLLMDKIMEHGSTASVGSAHAAIETALLGTNEYALVHDNPTGQPQDCVVKFSVRSI